MTDLLNNYLNQNKQQPASQPLPAIKIDLNTANKIKPLEGRGHMLPSRLFSSPISYAKDLKQDIVNIKKGAQGKANDHELGRMNDLAMKAGSLGLAAYLFVKNPLKLKKTMEFVGFGSFFASMALWPKLAIQAPLKAKFGVDIHQKYEDSYGRKKTFFQDPQYVPWDMVSKEDLNKMGDKMKVPTDIKNRDEVIKQKAQKIAVQGNTLWMATAGLATPLMSALGCSVAEKAIGKAQQNASLSKAEKALDKHIEAFTPDLVSKATQSTYVAHDKDAAKALDAIFTKSNSEQLTPDMIRKISKIINSDSDIALGDAIEKELSQMAKSSVKVNDGLIATLSQNKALKGFTAEQIKNAMGDITEMTPETTSVISKNLASLIPSTSKAVDAEEAVEILTDVFNSAASEPVGKDFAQRLFMNNSSDFKVLGMNKEAVENFIKSQGEGFKITTENAEALAKKLSGSLGQSNILELERNQKSISDAIEATIKGQSGTTVGEAKSGIKKLFQMVDGFNFNKKPLDKYISVNVGDQAETFIANQWGKVNNQFLKSIGIKGKDLEIAKLGNNQSVALIDTKLKKLAENPEQYKKAMSELSESIAEYDKQLSKGLQDKIGTAVDTIYNPTAKSFQKEGFSNIAQFFTGKITGFKEAKSGEAWNADYAARKFEEGLSQTLAGSAKHSAKSYVDSRIMGARASMYRMVQTMDLYKRMADGTFDKQLLAQYGSENLVELVQKKKDMLNTELKNIIDNNGLHPGKIGWLEQNFDSPNLRSIIENEMNGHINNELKGTLAKNLENIKSGKESLDLDNIRKLFKNADVPKLENEVSEELISGIRELAEQYNAKKIDFHTFADTAAKKTDEVGSALLKSMLNIFDKADGLIPKSIAELQKSGMTVAEYTKIATKKSVEAMLSYKITDYTEKLNNVGPAAYKGVIDVMFGQPVDSATKTVLDEKNILQNFDSYRKEFIDKVANSDYWYKPHHVLNGVNQSANSSWRHILVGSSIEDMVNKAANNAFNTNKWMKTFGIAGIALVGTTLLAQQFFGKMKNEDVYAGEKK
ncbi:MAG: hypothetical protein PHV37_04200 [Candidatus Gastranaerophilales bacterium]|nr:hypothetical protein [Candidatus Gastranaerophilales bacterium]